MLCGNIGHSYLDGIQAVRDTGDPFLRSKRCDTERDGLIEGRCGHLDRVLDVIQVFNRDAA